MYEDDVMKSYCHYFTNFARVEYEVIDGQETDNELKRNKWRFAANKTIEQYDE
jgi:hypothetical protein